MINMDLNLFRFSSSESARIEGKKTTMSETFKYYNKLVGKTGKELKNLSDFVSCDASLPLFEEKLCLTLIDSLKLENEVVKVLLSQNNYRISKVLGFKWFFKNLSSEFCTKELFPFISLSVRCKVVNRLSKHLENTEEAQKYFEFIRNKYDIERANYLLPRCSPEFILRYFEETKLTFEHNNEVRILFNICQRYPRLGIQILSSIFEIKKEQRYALARYKKILLYLSGNHADLIVPFIKKYFSCIPSNTFGIRLTKKLGSKIKEDLFPDIMKSFLFREKLLFSMLSNEEQVKYLTYVVSNDSENLSFENWKASNHKMSQLLKLLSEEKRLKMIESVFKEVFNSNFGRHSKCWTSEILEILPAKTREPFLQKLEVFLKKAEESELEENVDACSFSPEFPEKLMYLYDSSIAFERLKEIIRLCPTVARRESILTFMVKSCKINNDTRVLQQVVEFVAARHRNDDYSVISGFSSAISSSFPSSKLNSAIFEKLEELTYFFSLKRSSNDCYSHWKELHIFYRLENDMEVDENVFFQSIILKSNRRQSFMRVFRSKQSKTFLLSVCRVIIQWIQNNSTENFTGLFQNTVEMLLMNLINTCKEFNDKNKNNRIFMKDIKGLEEIAKKKAEEKLGDIGGGEWPTDVWEMIFASRCYGDIFSSHYKPMFLYYIVKRYPEWIVKYLDGFVRTLLSIHFIRDRKFCNFFLMNVSFLGVTEHVKEMIRNEFENNQATHKRKAALELYSHMCTIEEFTSLIERYIPKQERIETKQDDFDEIQMSIPGLIKNVKPRWKSLTLILKFYLGDFLKSVLPSFSACCYHTRYDFVIPFLKEQLKAAPPKISYKKNIIRLIVELSNREDRSNFYMKCWEEYQHYSVRSILMLFISKSFLENPSRESFRVLEKCILESDEVTIETKPNLSKIPKEFFSDYVSTLWQFSESREKAFKDNFRREILWGFNWQNINFLPTEFCESIIKYGLFNSFSDNGIETFTVMYLAFRPENVDRRVHFVLDLIKTRKPSSRSLFEFIKVLISTSQNRPAAFAEIFTLILENWPEYPIGVLFEERILLNYYSLHYKVLKKISDSHKITVEFGKELKNFFVNVENLNDLVFIYSKVLKNFLKVFRTPNAIHVVKELVVGTPNRTLALLAILSLPEETVVWHNMEGKILNKNIIEGKKALIEIFHAVEGCNDRVVEIYMRSKFAFVKS